MGKIDEQRNYKVVQANDLYRLPGNNKVLWLIQQTRAELLLSEKKFIRYLISKVQPGDIELQEYTFSIKEFCQVCGIHDHSGRNYKRIADMVLNLAQKAKLIEDGDKIILFRWIETPVINRATGKLTVRLNPLLSNYLLDNKRDFFQYEFVFALPMKSTYSIELYDLAKSYIMQKSVEISLDELKNYLGTPEYDYAYLNKFILKKSIEEINQYTDIHLNVEPIREGRKVKKIRLTIDKLDYFTRHENYIRTKALLDGDQDQEDQIPGQMTIGDYTQEGANNGETNSETD